MQNFKSDFPIFQNNPGLIYLDNGASAQKPQYVIDGVSDFVSKDYANIHRGMYNLSERSEEAYHYSKKVVAEFLNCTSAEVFYTYNTTYGINIVAQALINEYKLGPDDTVLVGIRDHHANVLPWQALAEQFGFSVKFIEIDVNYGIDREDFTTKYDDSVKIVAVGHVSNVTGKIYDMKQIRSKLRDDTFFLIDGTQAIPHFKVDVEDIGCDCYAFTGHKVMSYTGIGAVYLKKQRIRELSPLVVGGGTIQEVDTAGYTLLRTNEKFEAGTPNITGAVSLAKALEYIDKIGGYETIQQREDELVSYALQQFAKREDGVRLVGPKTSNDRIGVFSFVLATQSNQNLIGEMMGEQNICIRCGGHCAHILHQYVGEKGTCRMSLYLYNTKEDIDRFFEVLDEIEK